MNYKVFWVGLVLLTASCGENIDAPLESLNGRWVATNNGVRVELIITETIKHDGFFGDYTAIGGRGSLAIESTGETFAVTPNGLHQSGPTGVLINLEAGPDANGNMKWYGHFWGQLDGGQLKGTLDTSVQNTVGPLISAPISFVRQ